MIGTQTAPDLKKTTKTCFIIMPISTPAHLMPEYSNDPDHFKHVLEHVFIPAVKEAGFDPIPPTVDGSDIIHAEIIRNLETADIVLCDMSTMNPNVFFEFGVRTALNKAVCVVRDDKTLRVPFDLNSINHHQYSSNLGAWMVEKEAKALTAHLSKSEEKSDGINKLWKYFSMSVIAHTQAGTIGHNDKFDYVLNELEGIRKMVSRNDAVRPYDPLASQPTVEAILQRQELEREVALLRKKMGNGLPLVDFDTATRRIIAPNNMFTTKQASDELRILANKFGYSVMYTPFI